MLNTEVKDIIMKSTVGRGEKESQIFTFQSENSIKTA